MIKEPVKREPYSNYQGYSKEQIARAMKLSKTNAECYPNAPEGFWFEKDGKKIYVVAPFLDITGTKELSFDESLKYYGEYNVKVFMAKMGLKNV